MARCTFAVLALLALGCAERAPAAPTWQDLDAEAPPRPGSGVTPSPGVPRTDGSAPTDCRARLLVIFDRSGSMAEPWETAEGPEPRWRVAARALDAALTPLADRLTVGAILFPTPTVAPSECGEVDPIGAQMPFDDGASFLARWRAVWVAPALGGSTPLDAAFARADDALPVDDLVTAVVVLTDGQPTCRTEPLAEEHAAAWLADGTSTWVVGLPGARLDAEDVLNAIARAGGTGAYRPVDEPATLTDDLALIAGGAVEQACR